MSEAHRLNTILIATNNPGKAREIEAVLSECGAGTLGDKHPVAPGKHSVARMDDDDPHLDAVRWVTLSDLEAEIPEPVEDQDSFEGNSQLKAVYYSRASGLVTLADDSGLEVDALGGAPGVYSARYAEVEGEPPRAERDLANNRKLIAALAGVQASARTARFRCVLTLADGDRVLAQASGAIEGQIIDEPRGEGGFGYDPHFLVPELGKTTAELPAEHKNRISHRGVALRLLRGLLRGLKVQI
ncbi:MAG: non-canonical purine NTP pyrophosphatase [Phycisphaerales bacterium]|nr:non-canonical purine NTP pyrophosphatase [Phycisphaerales bacterium]MCB9856243.1 non-canonical purine NTP pyrophosphatase [Phycisphaerales bacterium]MCB9863318.1 non-canonical purine NTP pyrophosphatase [Phycisphaerales bacterium]